MTFLKVLIVSLMHQSDDWQIHTLPIDMRPIAFLESTNGINISHKPDIRGEIWSAYGPLGLKFVTAYETYKKSALLKLKYPNLNEQDFIRTIKRDVALYNLSAIEHWRRVRTTFAQLDYAVYSWRYGVTAAKGATQDQVANDSYVAAYKKLARVVN